MAFSVLAEFILFHSLSVGFMIYEIMELQIAKELLDAVFFVIISLPILVLIARYDIPF